MKTHTFCGRKYKIELDPIDGWCDQRKMMQQVWLMRDLKTKAGLETAIHEGLHACHWNASEENVTQTAYDIARFLWRLNYRKQAEK